MTLLSRIHELQLKAVAADDEDRIKSRAGVFATLRERLEAATTNAARANTGREELQSVGIIQEGYEQSRVAVLAEVESLISTLENLSIDANFDTMKTQASLVEAHFKRSEKFVADAWKQHLSLSPPTVDVELLDSLEQAGVAVEAIRSDIESAESTLITLGARKLPEQGDNAKLQKALDILSSIGERIGKLIDPVIADIVVRAQGDGVPYSDMTPEVVSTLKRLGILDRLRIVLK
jgi:hypothetical protein